MKALLLALGIFWMPYAVHAAPACTTETSSCGIGWHSDIDGTSSNRSKITPTNRVSYWTFDRAGESALLRSECPRNHFHMRQGSATIHLYTCVGPTFATDCRRVEARSSETGQHGPITITDDTPFLLNDVWPFYIAQVQTGQASTATLMAVCGE